MNINDIKISIEQLIIEKQLLAKNDLKVIDYDNAISALKKQLPIKTVYETACWEVCPVCHSHYVGYKYCTHCGQRLER